MDPDGAAASGTAVVFNIERHALHDGPGIRTLVFLKGCTMACSWCSNPEGQSIRPQIIFYANRCTNCARCIDACPYEAIGPGTDHVATDRNRCAGCGCCVEVCQAGARLLAGKMMTVEQVLEVVQKDEVFYRHSGGGMTVSGGEPLMQSQFLHLLLSACREQGIHTAIETCGNVPWESFERILPVTDLFLYDVKHVEEEKHTIHTGAANRRILENLARLAGRTAEIIVRIPVVPRFNLSLRELGDIIAVVRSLPSIREVHLLPYHRLGTPKYPTLDREYDLPQLRPVSVSLVRRLAEQFSDSGLPVRIDV